ncbi:MAG TPA: BON domain-containing protein [Candidatus Binatia bacterium]|jgi:osmotically-inducible protein OsmY
MEDNVKEIRAALEKDRRINLHRFPIAVSVENGDLVLEGEVENIAAKKLAVLLVANIEATARIVDRLRVVPAETMGDQEIRDHVCRVLLDEAALERCLILAGDVEMRRQVVAEPAGSIVVEVADGIVTLNGSVPSLSHKRLAGVLAWWVPGCRDVVNGLEEVPLESDNDDELVDAVRLVLEKDPFVNAGMIRVSSENWIVTLEGLVPNDMMKKMAERDAWYVLGVKQVINEIQTKE